MGGGRRGLGSEHSINAMMDADDESPSFPSSKSSALDELNFTHRSHWQLAPWLTGLVLSLVVFVILIPAICSACYHWYSYKREAEEEDEDDDERESDLEDDDEEDPDDDDDDSFSEEGQDSDPLFGMHTNDDDPHDEDGEKEVKKNIGVQVRHDTSQTPSISSSLAHSASGVPPAPPPPAPAATALIHQASIPSDLSERPRFRDFPRAATIGEMEDPSAWLLLQNQFPIVHAEPTSFRPQSSVLHHRYYHQIRPPSSSTAESSSSTTIARETSLNHLLDYITSSGDHAVLKTVPRTYSLLENRDFVVEIHPRNKWSQKEFLERQLSSSTFQQEPPKGGQQTNSSGSHLETEV